MEPITLDDVPVLIMVVDRQHIIQYANAKAFEVFGYEPYELVGKNIDILVPEPFRERHHSMVDGFFDEPISRPLGVGRDLFGLCKDGSQRQIEIGLSLVVVRESPCVLATVIDVEVRKKLETIATTAQILAKIHEKTLNAIEGQTET